MNMQEPTFPSTSAGDAVGARDTVLLVDDEASILEVYGSLLARDYACVAARSVSEAQEHLRSGEVAAVLVDVMMPGADGFEMLRRVRAVDLDVPVILITGSPSLDSAIRAVERGAFRFLVKPISAQDLRAAIGAAVRQCKLARAHRQARDVLGASALPADEAGREEWVDDVLASLQLHVHPILDLRDQSLFAVEGLSRFQRAALPGVEEVIHGIESAGRLAEFGRAVRNQAADLMRALPSGAHFFVNLHPTDLLDADLYDPDSALARNAHRVVLEVTERGRVAELSDLGGRLARLRDLGFRLAVDDLGAGNNGLATFSQLEPEFVKLDRVLVQGAASNLRLYKIVMRLCQLSREMGAKIIAEGIETAAQEEAMRSAGCDFVQGWLYGRPAPMVEVMARGTAAREGFAPARRRA